EVWYNFLFGNGGSPPGVTVALHALAKDGGTTGQGPFYWYGGSVDGKATATIYGAAMSQRTRAGALFVNVPEGEYRVTVDGPTVTCFLSSAGVAGNGENYYGFTSPHLNEARAPVLAGHSTPFILIECLCSSRLLATTNAVDAAACPMLPDAALR